MAEARVQRRLAAILAADVVGYSRLMEQDEVGTPSAMRSRRSDVLVPLVTKHAGRIFKFTGDGVFVEFPSAVDAVKCAVDLQDAMAAANIDHAVDRRILLRIGIDLGDIVSEDDDVFGDGVNIAARLEALAAPGGILISRTVFEHVGRKLAFRFQDQGEKSLKNISGMIRTYRVERDAVLDRATSLHAPSQAAQPRTTSIAVLPFVNMSSDADQSFFADGLAEDLITDLSKIPGLFVIARNSSFSYRNRTLDVRLIARELGVRYILEGSVRRAATRVRINAQLIDADSGSHVWADRFDRDLTDIFAMQDEVIGRIVKALSIALPATPRHGPVSVEAYDAFVQGRSLTSRACCETRAARRFLQRAIDLEPSFAEAHAWLALSHHVGWIYCGEAIDKHRSLARAAAERAVALDPRNADGHIILGYLRAYAGDLTDGVQEYEQGLQLNPNHAEGWAMLADLRVLEGRAQEGIDCVRHAFRLNPHPPGDYYWLLGWAEYAAGKYEAAVATLRDDAAAGPGRRRILAAALAQLGRLEEARDEAARFLAEHPDFRTEEWGRTQPFRRAEDRQHFIDGYLGAGLPA